MTAAIALKLGRVSNLPTVWSNVLAGTVLAGGEPWPPATLVVMLAVSLLYIGGMCLVFLLGCTNPLKAGCLNATSAKVSSKPEDVEGEYPGYDQPGHYLLLH